MNKTKYEGENMNHDISEKYEQMTSLPVETLICRQAGPSIVIMMISALYNMADTYFVGTFGSSATAAVGVAFSLMALIQSIGFFFGHGSGNYISRQLGAQNRDSAATMAALGFFSAWITVFILGLVGIFFLDSLTVQLGATPTIVPHAKQYIFYILLGAPWMASSLMLNNLLRFQGSSFYGMIGMTTGAILNIILDPVFIFVLNMGVAGAGLATALSQFVSCIILWICCSKGDNIPIRLRNFRPSLKLYKQVVKGGTPSLCRQGIASISTIFLNRTAGLYGDSAIAAFSIVSRVSLFASSALVGFGQGFQPVCGFNYGAKQYDRVQRAFWFCVKISSVFLCVMAVIGAIWAPQITYIFQKNDPEAVRLGAAILRLQCLSFPLLGFVTISNMFLQTIGDALKASAIAGARQGFFLVPCLYVLPRLFQIKGLQVCQPVSDTATFILSVPLVFKTLTRMKKETARQASPPAGSEPNT